MLSCRPPIRVTPRRRLFGRLTPFDGTPMRLLGLRDLLSRFWIERHQRQSPTTGPTSRCFPILRARQAMPLAAQVRGDTTMAAVTELLPPSELPADTGWSQS